MSLLAKLTVKPLLYAVGVLALLCLALGIALYVQQARHAATVSALTAQASGWRTDYGVAAGNVVALTAANTGWQGTVETLQAQIKAEQAQCTALSARNDKAVAAAKAQAADADAALKAFVGRYAEAVRAPDCAAALHALPAACPSLEDY